MSFDGEFGIVAIHAAAVVAHAHQPATTFLEVDVHRGGAGVERVLQQFLHHRRRAFNDLAGRDLIGDFARQHGYARQDFSMATYSVLIARG